MQILSLLSVVRIIIYSWYEIVHHDNVPMLVIITSKLVNCGLTFIPLYVIDPFEFFFFLKLLKYFNSAVGCIMTCFNPVIGFCWYYIISSVTCFNSVISFCWYYIIPSLTCFNSFISFCWYYIITCVACFNSFISFCWYYIITSVTCFNSVISFWRYYIITSAWAILGVKFGHRYSPVGEILFCSLQGGL